MLPVGLSDHVSRKLLSFFTDNMTPLQLRQGPPVGYCPLSGEVYKMAAWGDFLDGAYFGTTFPHLLLMQVTTVLLRATSGVVGSCD